MKKNSKLLITMLASSMLFSLTGCDQGKAQTEQAFVSVDINPSIELVLDGNNKVVRIHAANEDAQVLLYAEENLIGADVDVVLKRITELAIELDYLSEENSVIHTAVISLKNEKEQQALKADIHAELTTSAASFGLEINATENGNFSLYRKLEALKEKYPTDAIIQNISIEKFKLALAAAENGKIALEEAIHLTEQELIQIITKAYEKAEVFATDAYNFAKAQAISAFEQASGMARDGVYSTYYMKNFAKHPSTFYYGSVYQMYQFASKGFDAIADAAEYASIIANTPLDEAQIAQVVSLLNLDDSTLEAIKDSQGNITIESIDAYANKLFKNSELNEQMEQLAEQLATTLNETEALIEEKINQLQEEYADEIQALLMTAEGLISPLNAWIASLPENVRQDAQTCIADFKVLINELKEILQNGLTISKLREYSGKMAEKAANMLERIQKDLSEQELEEIEKIQQEIDARFQLARERMENAIAQAEQSAKDYFSQLKENRKHAY